MDEIWKNIEGYEGLYMISNFGRVKCLEHKCPGRYKNKPRTVKEHIMKITLNKENGYYYTTLSNLDRGRTFAVHRLVAKAFLPNPENLPYINHKDRNRQNNNVDNLEWCTPLYNNTYMDAHLHRKRYEHRWEYEKDKLLYEVAKVMNRIDEFKEKYPNAPIDEMIEEIKQNRNGK